VTFVPADNLGDTLTVGELRDLLVTYPDDALVVIRICLTAAVNEAQEGDLTVSQGENSVTIRHRNPLDCAIEADDVEPGDGVVYLCTGHEVIEAQLLS
jgi:hypothetical protein